MTTGERGGRGAVAEPAGQQRRPALRPVMDDLDGRVIADPPARLVQSPDQVDILAVPQVLVEPAGPGERGRPHQQRGGGHVTDPAARLHPGRPPPEIQAAARPLVPPGRARGRRGDDPRRDRGDQRIGQMRDEVAEPAGRRHAVAVDERDQLGTDPGKPAIPGGGRATGQRAAAQFGVVPPGDGRDRRLVGRSVVHHDHRAASFRAGLAHGGQARRQPLRPVLDRDDHGHPAGDLVAAGRLLRAGRLAGACGRDGMREPGVGQPPR